MDKFYFDFHGRMYLAYGEIARMLRMLNARINVVMEDISRGYSAKKLLLASLNKEFDEKVVECILCGSIVRVQANEWQEVYVSDNMRITRKAA